jgi:formylglycine-generating enzyme required for sulfatase activity
MVYALWLGGTLPTDAQWQYAARRTGAEVITELIFIGETTRGVDYSDLQKVGWYGSGDGFNSGGFIHEVGQLEPTALGLYDMSGNVNEWCADWGYMSYSSGAGYDDILTTPVANNAKYTVSDCSSSKTGASHALAVLNPIGRGVVSVRVIRGGSKSAVAGSCSLAYRGGYAPVGCDPDIGFHCVVCW